MILQGIADSSQLRWKTPDSSKEPNKRFEELRVL
jgi:hypothetical protein